MVPDVISSCRQAMLEAMGAEDDRVTLAAMSILLAIFDRPDPVDDAVLRLAQFELSADTPSATLPPPVVGAEEEDPPPPPPRVEEEEKEGPTLLELVAQIEMGVSASEACGDLVLPPKRTLMESSKAEVTQQQQQIPLPGAEGEPEPEAEGSGGNRSAIKSWPIAIPGLGAAVAGPAVGSEACIAAVVGVICRFGEIRIQVRPVDDALSECVCQRNTWCAVLLMPLRMPMPYAPTGVADCHEAALGDAQALQARLRRGHLPSGGGRAVQGRGGAGERGRGGGDALKHAGDRAHDLRRDAGADEQARAARSELRACDLRAGKQHHHQHHITSTIRTAVRIPPCHVSWVHTFRTFACHGPAKDPCHSICPLARSC